MKPRPELSADYVRSLLDYNPDTGEFRWEERPVSHFKGGQKNSAEAVCRMWNTQNAGKPAGVLDSYGYRLITIDSRPYKAHRLAILIMTGQSPVSGIDHKDGRPGNNRWGNLREATPSENACNAGKRRGASRFKGVSWIMRHKNWRAVIIHNKRRYDLGSHATEEEAAAAYDRAAVKLHGLFARTNSMPGDSR